MTRIAAAMNRNGTPLNNTFEFEAEKTEAKTLRMLQSPGVVMSQAA
jgi:hypothetical protein